MIEISERVKDRVRIEALELKPRECCGFVIKRADDTLDIFPCANVAINNEEQYYIKIENYILAEAIGEVIGVYHSHTKGTNSFSNADLTLSDKLELLNVLYIVETDKFYTYYPKLENEPIS